MSATAAPERIDLAALIDAAPLSAGSVPPSCCAAWLP